MRRRVRYLRTDEYVDTINSLTMAAESAKAVADRPLDWKWLLVAVHSAVQGGFVLVLLRGDALLTMKPHHAKAWIKAYARAGPWPRRVDLDYFLALYAKAKSNAIARPPSGAKFTVEEHHDYAMETLNNFRNAFIHYSPHGWSIEIWGLPRLVMHCLEPLRFLLLESGSVVWPKASMPNRVRHEWIG